jgi:hypothetical protein
MRVLTILALTAITSGCSSAPPAALVIDSTAAAAGTASMPRSVRCDEPIGPADWQQSPDDVAAGPLRWPHLKQWATSNPAGYGYHDSAGFHYKVGVELKAGSTVTVTVAPLARGQAGLEYGLRWGYRPAQAVTFHACPDADTAYVGGFFVKRNSCVPLDIQVGNARPVRIVVSVFAGRCPG